MWDQSKIMPNKWVLARSCIDFTLTPKYALYRSGGDTW